jgi:mannosidase alpha-like ER degradation enhancer 1
VYINDPNAFRTPGEDSNLAQSELRRRELQVQLRIFSPDIESVSNDNIMDLSITGYTASFGADLSSSHILNTSSAAYPAIVRPEGVPIQYEDLNPHGCVSFENRYPDSALIVQRGKCTFLQKLLYARAASASAIIIINDNNLALNPTADPDELHAAGDVGDAAVILLPKKIGEALEDMIIATGKSETAEIRISVDTKGLGGVGDLKPSLPVGKDKKDKDATRILYINGHPLINTRLLV